MKDDRKSCVGKNCVDCGEVIIEAKARRNRCVLCAREQGRRNKIALEERKAAGLPARPLTWEQARAEEVRRRRDLGVFDENDPMVREWAREQRRAEFRARLRDAPIPAR